MDADQRVVEMRTHEDVVTNVSYEAAARIMAAQRKSEQLEHELRVTKDETVLKMLMDDKVIHASIPSQPEFTKTTELKAGNDKGYTGTMMNKGESAVGMSVPIVQEKGASTKPPYCEPKPTDAASEGPSLPGDKRVTEGKNASQRKKAKQDDSESSLRYSDWYCMFV
ncbi:hypothetical protein DCAR_0624686 [Daucus carota subsp. sativus]|uniref:Uncharacterized protein n=1 Tax=Daucus carota subsp. sativus TaxID=79200 RepID=A0A164VZF0_DAUCS|nr:hypothetical protein DCAR_0624686 [Daucus carota subsp. sativus]